MNEQTHIHTNNGVLFSHGRKEGNPAVNDNMGEPWRYYARWTKSERKRQIPYTWNLLHDTVSEIKQKIGCWLPGAGRSGRNGYQLPSYKMDRSGALMHSIVTVVNHTVLHIVLLHVLTTQKIMKR